MAPAHAIIGDAMANVFKISLFNKRRSSSRSESRSRSGSTATSRATSPEPRVGSNVLKRSSRVAALENKFASSNMEGSANASPDCTQDASSGNLVGENSAPDNLCKVAESADFVKSDSYMLEAIVEQSHSDVNGQLKALAELEDSSRAEFGALTQSDSEQDIFYEAFSAPPAIETQPHISSDLPVAHSSTAAFIEAVSSASAAALQPELDESDEKWEVEFSASSFSVCDSCSHDASVAVPNVSTILGFPPTVSSIEASACPSSSQNEGASSSLSASAPKQDASCVCPLTSFGSTCSQPPKGPSPLSAAPDALLCLSSASRASVWSLSEPALSVGSTTPTAIDAIRSSHIPDATPFATANAESAEVAGAGGQEVVTSATTLHAGENTIEPLGIPLPSTYAEATNVGVLYGHLKMHLTAVLLSQLAFQFPELSEQILKLPLPWSKDRVAEGSDDSSASVSASTSTSSTPVGECFRKRGRSRGPVHTDDEPNWALAPDSPRRQPRPTQRGRGRGRGKGRGRGCRSRAGSSSREQSTSRDQSISRDYKATGAGSTLRAKPVFSAQISSDKLVDSLGAQVAVESLIETMKVKRTSNMLVAMAHDLPEAPQKATILAQDTSSILQCTDPSAAPASMSAVAPEFVPTQVRARLLTTGLGDESAFHANPTIPATISPAHKGTYLNAPLRPTATSSFQPCNTASAGPPILVSLPPPTRVQLPPDANEDGTIESGEILYSTSGSPAVSTPFAPSRSASGTPPREYDLQLSSRIKKSSGTTRSTVSLKDSRQNLCDILGAFRAEGLSAHPLLPLAAACQPANQPVSIIPEDLMVTLKRRLKVVEAAQVALHNITEDVRIPDSSIGFHSSTQPSLLHLNSAAEAVVSPKVSIPSSGTPTKSTLEVNIFHGGQTPTNTPAPSAFCPPRTEAGWLIDEYGMLKRGGAKDTLDPPQCGASTPSVWPRAEDRVDSPSWRTRSPSARPSSSRQSPSPSPVRFGKKEGIRGSKHAPYSPTGPSRLRRETSTRLMPSASQDSVVSTSAKRETVTAVGTNRPQSGHQKTITGPIPTVGLAHAIGLVERMVS
ncbi:uncharacterized protein FIBRA_02721 [Fibroporia radiculosa]|uniref:Uncharacterized protein n=1 Tax=Fibroporia radiculosa TaxID=599839 RepID=J4HVD7_9APHY|nr:uncharacterized protein FIBRA_02721 [Fibroporia radiculosa]CCM00682.1 predicted protein [Fibroporia radiculosa]